MWITMRRIEDSTYIFEDSWGSRRAFNGATAGVGNVEFFAMAGDCDHEITYIAAIYDPELRTLIIYSGEVLDADTVTVEGRKRKIVDTPLAPLGRLIASALSRCPGDILE